MDDNRHAKWDSHVISNLDEEVKLGRHMQVGLWGRAAQTKEG